MYEFFRKIVCLSMHIKYRIKVIGGDNRPYKNGIKGGLYNRLQSPGLRRSSADSGCEQGALFVYGED